MKQFEESLNTAVYTTSYILKGSPIVFVVHDNEGDWQFHGPEDNVKDSEMKLVALGEIIAKDNSILELADMPQQCEAIRRDRNSPWKIINRN